ncbi:MAG: hypothetical protein CVU56_06855 [Deltaproteobacteria bacterium HGW-Deltaproteobacteria-14]|jgi:hypothetical protein|nr:MAG: hypothetical protein CVU56_06855 [Deltaproteobacteria bacterium HGW-Deltaproteobacteria-14]
MSGRLLSAFGLALALTFSSVPADAAPPPSGKHTPYSAFNHNGFLMRLSAGFGYTRASQDSSDGSLVLSGGGGMASLAFGGMIAKNLALNVDIFGSSAFEPAVVVDGTDIGDASSTTMSVGAIGLGVTYYLMPANVYLALSFGAAKGRLETRARTVFGTIVFKDTSDVGFAVNVMVGKEWWVGREWGIGVAGQFIIGTLPASGGDIHPMALGVALTATFN